MSQKEKKEMTEQKKNKLVATGAICFIIGVLTGCLVGIYQRNGGEISIPLVVSTYCGGFVTCFGIFNAYILSKKKKNKETQ